MNNTIIISIIGLCLTVVSSWIGYKRGLQKDSNAEGSLRSDVGYIKSSVDDLKIEQKNFNNLHYGLAERVGRVEEHVGRVEESTKSAHKRIDSIEEKIK